MPKANFTLENIRSLFSDPLIATAYANSIRISIVTAVVGGILGFLMAYAVTVGGLPRGVRAGAGNLCRCCLQLRSRPPGIPVHQYPGPDRADDGFYQPDLWIEPV